MVKDICLYQRHNLKSDIIKAFVIFIYTNYYILCKNFQIIKVSNNAEKEVLLKKINNDKLREIKIHRLISNNEKGLGIDFEKKNNLSLLSR